MARFKSLSLEEILKMLGELTPQCGAVSRKIMILGLRACGRRDPC